MGYAVLCNVCVRACLSAFVRVCVYVMSSVGMFDSFVRRLDLLTSFFFFLFSQPGPVFHCPVSMSIWCQEGREGRGDRVATEIINTSSLLVCGIASDHL